MNETSERILSQLEEVTNQMATGGIPSLHEFVILAGRRDELVRQWRENPGDGEDALRRLGAIVRGGAEAESRARAIRESVRREMEAVEPIRRLAQEIRGMIAAPPHIVNLEA